MFFLAVYILTIGPFKWELLCFTLLFVALFWKQYFWLKNCLKKSYNFEIKVLELKLKGKIQYIFVIENQASVF